MNFRILFVLVACTFLRCSQGARIVGVFPLAGKSVNMLYNKLMVALANAGHDVTMISGHDPKAKLENGSLKHIMLTGFWDNYDDLMERVDPWNIVEHSNIMGSVELVDFTAEMWSDAFKIPEVKKLLSSNETFDAVITEDIYNDCFRILGHIFNAPVILFSSYGGPNIFSNAALGNPLLPSYVPHFNFVGPNYGGMNFVNRLRNFLTYVVDKYVRDFYVMPVYNRILQNNFDNPPDITTFYNNVSLLLLGSHSSVRIPAPLLPNAVEIGGFHIDPPKKLPKDLQVFLDGATDGAIFFSLGSHISSKDMPAATKKIFLDVFRQLKQRVVWKFEEDLPDKPDNVLIQKWLPQTDILGHPNTKLFITHGGHGSLLETVYHGVPCLMIPVFFDQYNNAYQAVELGIAIKITYQQETEETLKRAVTELLYNPKYRDNAKQRQSLFHDRPMKPIDTALYWIEYVIRQKGAHHLKLPSVNMPWYQLYSVDVIVFLLALFLIGLYLPYFAIKRICCSRTNVGKLKAQ